MYSVSEEYIEQIKKPYAFKRTLRGTINNVPFTEDDILSGSFSVSNQCSDTNEVQIGSVYVGELMLYAKGEKEVLKHEWFSEQIEMQFEGKAFCAPVDYHEYLTRQFNDYMKLPPKEDQVTHHVFKAYAKR